MGSEDNGERVPPGGKRQFLVHVDGDLVRRIKILAINRGVTASSLVQEALVDFLDRQPDRPNQA